MPLRILIALCALLAGRVAMAEADYRTVVIFGDTQELVDGRPDPDLPLQPRDPDDRENLTNLEAMIDWVLEKRSSENIDFVLHVGDIIQSGGLVSTPIPAPCYPEGECRSEIEYKEGSKCPCHWEEQIDTEWARFNQAWQRLEGVVPYAIVRGNHDNVGSHKPGDRPGFNQYYGAERMSGLPGYVESSPFEDVGHLWKFKLGAHPVLVMGLPDRAGFKAKQTQWANEVLSRPENRELPTILLTHRFFIGVPVDYSKPYRTWTRIVEKRPEQIFMTVWGHVSPGKVRLVDVGGKKILDVRSNWQAFTKGAYAAMLTLVRFNIGPEGIEWVTVQAFTPAAGFDTSPQLSETRMGTRSFSVPLTGTR
jgi:hypothetical protein